MVTQFASLFRVYLILLKCTKN